jgi:alkanesulfonate monooxygenase
MPPPAKPFAQNHSIPNRPESAVRRNSATLANDGYVEDNLWTGIARARSGCGAAIVGDPDQVLAKLRRYEAMGIEAFILSGYPHIAERDLFARLVLPHLDHAQLRFDGGPAPS